MYVINNILLFTYTPVFLDGENRIAWPPKKYYALNKFLVRTVKLYEYLGVFELCDGHRKIDVKKRIRFVINVNSAVDRLLIRTYARKKSYDIIFTRTHSII